MTSYRNTIVNADCTAFLPTLPSGIASFVLTDPPYLVNYRARDGRTVQNDSSDTWLKPAFAEIYRVLQPDSFCVSFYGWPHADRFMGAFRAAGFRPVGHLVFPKPYSSSVGHVRCQHECAYLLAKGNPKTPNPLGDVIDWVDYTGNRLHPTQKPISILIPLIENYSASGGLVVDPFAGSGSTLAAAKMLGREWLGVESDPKYCAVASTRLGCYDPETISCHASDRASGVRWLEV